MGCDFNPLLFQTDKSRPDTDDKVLDIINTNVLIKLFPTSTLIGLERDKIGHLNIMTILMITFVELF
jgi:hypothetical protein